MLALVHCPRCAARVLPTADNACPNCRASLELQLAGTARTTRQAGVAEEAQHAPCRAVGPATNDHSAARPISATAGRLVLGALIVGVTVYAGSFVGLLIDYSGIAPSLVGCFVGLVMVSTTVFGNADALDRKRWQRYWHGDLLGYWLTYVPLTILGVQHALDGRHHNESELLCLDFLAYLAACIVGLGTGFLNVIRTDSQDQAEFAALMAQSEASDSTGHCVDCGGLIEPSRREAHPDAQDCLRCFLANAEGDLTNRTQNA